MVPSSSGRGAARWPAPCRRACRRGRPLRSASPPTRRGRRCRGRRPEQQHDHAGQRVVAAAVFFGQLLQLEPVLQLGHRDQAVDQPAAVVALHGPGVVGARRRELAGDRLEHVAHGDHALHLAVFVDHEHQLRARRRGSARAAPCPTAFRARTPAAAATRPATASGRAASGCSSVCAADHAEHVVQAAAAHRIARVLVVGDDAQHVVERRVDVEPDDLGARNHHRADLPVVEPEHVAHHLVLLRLDHAGVQRPPRGWRRFPLR